MKKNINKITNLILPLLLGVFLVYYAYKQFTEEQIQEILQNFKDADYSYIALASLFSLISLWARAYRWRYALTYMGYKSNTTTNFMAICIGYLLNLTVPRSGEVSRALVIQKYNQIPFDKGFGSIVAERIVDLFCLLSCVVLALALQFDLLKNFLSQYIPYNKLYLLVLAMIVLAVILWVIFTWVEHKIILFIKKKIQGVVEGLTSIAKMPNKKGFIILTLVIWLGYIATFYIAIYAIPQTSSLNFAAVMAAFVAGSFAVSFTNGGFGAFPLIITEVLLLYQIKAVSATAFGWILWTTQTAIVIILGCISFLALPFIYSKLKK
ncbi:lysylphosphatidylglycerol synthase transmembrane domain-containing protein [Myroides sp. LJL119]